MFKGQGYEVGLIMGCIMGETHWSINCNVCALRSLWIRSLTQTTWYIYKMITTDISSGAWSWTVCIVLYGLLTLELSALNSIHGLGDIAQAGRLHSPVVITHIYFYDDIMTTAGNSLWLFPDSKDNIPLAYILYLELLAWCVFFSLFDCRRPLHPISSSAPYVLRV